MPSELETQLSKAAAVCDQEWAAGVEWIASMKMSVVLSLREDLVNDNPSNLIEWMQSEPGCANVVGRLALLALDEILMRRVKIDHDIES